MRFKNSTIEIKSLLQSIGLMVFMAFSFALNAQSVTGTVTSTDDGQPLIGATVLIAGKATTGALTDADGKFSIAANKGDILIISYVGHQEQRVSVEGASINIALNPNRSLDEVVVVGYGSSKKSDLTGAVGSIKTEELKRLGTVDAVQAMQGRIAGVEITGQSGEPGAGARIRIRGVGTINNSEPLYVVDGFPVGSIYFLSPNDIESIEVLKDASATAIYGNRGANGVVLVTTKRGKSGAPKISFEAYRGIQQPGRKVELTNAAEYATLYLEAFANDGINLSDDSDIRTRLEFVKKNNLQGTDWQAEIFRQQAMIQNVSMNISGGTENNRYLFSATAFNQDGLVKNSDMKKYFIRLNNDMKISSWLNGGIGLNYVYTDKTYYADDQYSGVLPVALRVDPVTPAWDSYRNNWGRADISYNNNPARIVEQLRDNKGYDQGLLGNIFLEAKLFKGLRFRSQGNIALSFGHNKSYSPAFFVAVDEARDVSTLWERRSQGTNLTLTNYLTYDKSFGSHNLTVMAGQEAFTGKFNSFEATGRDVPASADLQFLSSSKSTDFTVNSNQSEEALLSYFGRFNYSFAGKYLLTATIRRDGSSRFLRDNRWGTFPSFAAGWNIAEESFLKNTGIFNQLKLRAGWGEVGNQNSAANYGYVTTVRPNNIYVFGGQSVQGFASEDLSNSELRWETTQQTNVGLDFSVLNDRLYGSADYFIKKTNDMIVAVPIPLYVGANPPRVNAGNMENRGIELNLNWRARINKAIRYELGVNFTKITNEVTSLGGGSPINGGNINKVGDLTRTEVGYEIAYFYGLKTNGIFQNQADVDNYKNSKGEKIQPVAQPGDIKFVDTNNDGVIDNLDRTYLGSGTPDYTFGINGALEVKGFDLRIFFQGVQGNEIANAMYWGWYASDGSKENYHRDRLNRWTPTNTNTNEPRMTINDANRNGQFSDRYIADGSYLRLKNLTIGYTLPNGLLSKAHVQNLRVYFSADNLWTRTNYKGLDPEIGERFYNPLYYGVDLGNYPQARNYRVGVNLNF
jgi:TonB-dependent starch-binding outer membrane protein SusC